MQRRLIYTAACANNVISQFTGRARQDSGFEQGTIQGMAASRAAIFVGVVSTVEAAEEELHAADVENRSSSRKNRMNPGNFFPFRFVASVFEAVAATL